jgi:streptogramin lyase
MTDFLTELREELLDGLERYERTARWRRPLAPRGRTLIGPAVRRIAAAAVAAAAAIAVAVQVDNRPSELERGTTPQVSRLEGFYAAGAVEADGSLWVTQSDISRLLRIDPRTGTVRAQIDLGGSPGIVISAAGALWVHDWDRGHVLKVDTRTNRVAATLALGLTGGREITFAAGAVWAGPDERGQLARIDPQTAAVTERVPLDPTVTDAPSVSLAVAGDTLWVVAGAAVTELDARTGRILGRARSPVLPLESSRRIGADDSGLWISSPERREVVHIDARTRQTTRFPVAGDPGALAIVDRRVWVGTLHDTGTLTRVTVLAEDGRIEGTMPVPHTPVQIIPSASGGAWITFGENSTLSPAALRLPDP